jgi:hypothetical protein
MGDDLPLDDDPKTYAPHDWFRDGQPVVIRLMPEYGTDIPLFPRSDFTDVLVPEELMGKLMRWQEVFLENFYWEKGWRSREVRDRWAADAVPLEAELRNTLAGKADLVVDLWPLPWSGPRS